MVRIKISPVGVALLILVLFALFLAGCVRDRERPVVYERKDISPPKVRESDKTVAIFVERGAIRDMQPLMGLIKLDLMEYCGLTLTGFHPLLPDIARRASPAHTYSLEVRLNKVRNAGFITDPRGRGKKSFSRAVVDAELIWDVTRDPISIGRGEADYDRDTEYPARVAATRKAILDVCAVRKRILDYPPASGIEVPGPERMTPNRSKEENYFDRQKKFPAYNAS